MYQRDESRSPSDFARSLILSSLSNQVIERNLDESAIKTFLTVIDHVLRARLDATRHSGVGSRKSSLSVYLMKFLLTSPNRTHPKA